MCVLYNYVCGICMLPVHAYWCAYVSVQVCTCAGACVCTSVCLSVRSSLASDSSKTIEVIIKLRTVAVSDVRMHHVLIILTLIFTQGHTDLNHEKNKCSIISETFQAMSFTFCVNIVRLKCYTIFASPMTLPSLEVTTASQTWSVLTCSLIVV